MGDIMELKDKLVKVDEEFTVTRYDNGYLVVVSGRDSNDDWASAKIMSQDRAKVFDLFEEFVKMERNE